MHQGMTPALVEVYPHPALLALMMNASRRIPYKISRAGRYWPTLSPSDRRRKILHLWRQIHRKLASTISGADLPFPSSNACHDRRTYHLWPTGSLPIRQPCDPLAGESLAPLRSRVHCDVEPCRDRGVVRTIASKQHDLDPHDISMLTAAAADSPFKLAANLVAQDDDERARPAHRRLRSSAPTAR
jgi:hypothetical protein